MCIHKRDFFRINKKFNTLRVNAPLLFTRRRARYTYYGKCGKIAGNVHRQSRSPGAFSSTCFYNDKATFLLRVSSE